MLKTKKRKKSPREALYTKLFNKAEKLWKELAFLRDGKACQVAFYFASDGLQHSEVLQVDHFITRGDKNLFFHPQNGTVVCSYCNGAKKWKTGAVEEKIRQIVMRREGGEAVGLMNEIHVAQHPNLLWKDPEWLEKQVIPMLEYNIKLLKETP